MSGKLLIVGDSFCSRYLQETRKIKTDDYLWKTPNYKYWFEYMGDKLKLDVLNLSFCGAGNQQIFDNTLYALNTNSDIEFAFICWSELDRVDLPYSHHFGGNSIHVNLSNKHDDKNSMRNKYNRLFKKNGLFSTLYMMDKFINYSVTIDNLLKHHRIKNIQAFTVNPYTHLYQKNTKTKITEYELYKEYMHHELFNKVNDENFFMFPGIPELGGGNFADLISGSSVKNWKDYVLNSEEHDTNAQDGWIIDGHPNGEGNKIIFDNLLDFTLDKYKKIV